MLVCLSPIATKHIYHNSHPFTRTLSFSHCQPTDLLQLLVDANCSSDNALEDGTVVAHAVSFLLAGYETTSSTVTYMSYLLALNPDIQERLANEIHSYLQEHPVGDLSGASLRQ